MTRAPQPPWPLIEVAVEPKSKEDRLRLAQALDAMERDDPAFRAHVDPESGQVILRGSDEGHLDDKVSTILRTYAVDLMIGAPQVSYRETTTRRVEVDYTHKRQFGGKREFARVLFVVEPSARETGFSFLSKIAGDAVPDAFIPGITKGLGSVLDSGVCAGFPVVDVTIALVDGAYHAVDSSPHAFEVASRAALREALQKGRSVLLEPVMAIEIVAPSAYANSVISDLATRRGRITGRRTNDGLSIIDADVPLANLFGYVNSLRAITRGSGTFAMRFARYDPSPTVDDDPSPPAAAAALRA